MALGYLGARLVEAPLVRAGARGRAALQPEVRRGRVVHDGRGGVPEPIADDGVACDADPDRGVACLQRRRRHALGGLDVGVVRLRLYPIVTSQYSSTNLYQDYYHI